MPRRTPPGRCCEWTGWTRCDRVRLPGSVQYVLDDCGAVALVATEAMADVVAGLDTSRIPVKVSTVGELAGFEHYDDVVAAFSAEALDDE